MTNRLLDWAGAPSSLWLLALMHVCFITNLAANASIGYAIPLQVLDGVTPDISSILQYDFYEPVYYKAHESSFPSESVEKLGRFVGVSENVGHALTFKVLTDDTQKVIHCSVLRSAMDPTVPNNRAGPEDTDEPHAHVKSRIDNFPKDEAQHVSMPIVDPEELTGRTFLIPADDGQTHRARIVEAIDDHEHATHSNDEHIKFKCSVNNDQYEELLSYREVLDYLEKDADNPIIWKFKRIVAHQGPLDSKSPNYKGSKYNV